MKKSFQLIATLLFGTALVACSSDESLPTPQPAEGSETAYLSVNIASTAGPTTKADESTFIYGTDAEQAVSDARFFFYDAAGNYVCEATVWNGGSANTASPAENIEYWGQSVLVLTGVTATNYPTDMVTVLNAPAGFTAPRTLTALEKTLAGGWQNTANNNFIITTSSYDQGEGASYFTTKLASTDFQTTASDAVNDQNAVNVYVERLAAKVVVNVDESGLSPVSGKTNLYKFTPTDFTIAGEDTPQTVYVQFLGWGLNATTTDSYLMKNIDRTQTITGFVWMDANNYRSYWGQSFNYGDNNVYYPASYAPDDKAYGLTYKTPVQLQAQDFATNNYAYCNENTNTPAILQQNFPTAITSVVVIAKVTDADGNGLDLIRYNGLLFQKDQYVEYVLNSLQAAGKISIKKNGATLQTTDVKLTNGYNGRVYVQLASDEEGWVTNDDNETTVAVADINAALKSFNTTSGNNAIAYSGGLMYYNIPIQHLNVPTTIDKTNLQEGCYGVVRNHCYSVTIYDLQHLGKGIFNPEDPNSPDPSNPDPYDPIIPDDDEEEYYHIGARIQILSWRNVSQRVVL